MRLPSAMGILLTKPTTTNPGVKKPPREEVVFFWGSNAANSTEYPNTIKPVQDVLGLARNAPLN